MLLELLFKHEVGWLSYIQIFIQHFKCFSAFFFFSFNSPGTWASLVPFQVSNRTSILPTNVQNYGLNIIGEPFLQAETSNWGRLKLNKYYKRKEDGTKKKQRRNWRKKKHKPAIAALTIINSLKIDTVMAKQQQRQKTGLGERIDGISLMRGKTLLLSSLCSMKSTGK